MCRVEVGFKESRWKVRKWRTRKREISDGLFAQTYLRHSTLGDVFRRMRPRPCCEHRGGASPAAVGSNSSLLLTKRTDRTATRYPQNKLNTRAHTQKHTQMPTPHQPISMQPAQTTTTSQQQQRPGLTFLSFFHLSLSNHFQSNDMTQFHQVFLVG